MRRSSPYGLSFAFQENKLNFKSIITYPAEKFGGMFAGYVNLFKYIGFGKILLTKNLVPRVFPPSPQESLGGGGSHVSQRVRRTALGAVR